MGEWELSNYVHEGDRNRVNKRAVVVDQYLATSFNGYEGSLGGYIEITKLESMSPLDIWPKHTSVLNQTAGLERTNTITTAASDDRGPGSSNSAEDLIDPPNALAVRLNLSLAVMLYLIPIMNEANAYKATSQCSEPPPSPPPEDEALPGTITAWNDAIAAKAEAASHALKEKLMEALVIFEVHTDDLGADHVTLRDDESIYHSIEDEPEDLPGIDGEPRPDDQHSTPDSLLAAGTTSIELETTEIKIGPHGGHSPVMGAGEMTDPSDGSHSDDGNRTQAWYADEVHQEDASSGPSNGGSNRSGSNARTGSEASAGPKASSASRASSESKSRGCSGVVAASRCPIEGRLKGFDSVLYKREGVAVFDSKSSKLVDLTLKTSVEESLSFGTVSGQQEESCEKPKDPKYHRKRRLLLRCLLCCRRLPSETNGASVDPVVSVEKGVGRSGSVAGLLMQASSLRVALRPDSLDGDAAVAVAAGSMTEASATLQATEMLRSWLAWVMQILQSAKEVCVIEVQLPDDLSDYNQLEIQGILRRGGSCLNDEGRIREEVVNQVKATFEKILLYYIRNELANEPAGSASIDCGEGSSSEGVQPVGPGAAEQVVIARNDGGVLEQLMTYGPVMDCLVTPRPLERGAHLYRRIRETGALGLMTHHGIYVGRGNVIHFSGNESALSTLLVPNKELTHLRKASLRSFMDGHQVVRVRNYVRSKNEPLIGPEDTPVYKSGQPWVIEGDVLIENAARRAEFAYCGFHEFPDFPFPSYNLFLSNCEHFATWCSTGSAFSLQVRGISTGIKGLFKGFNS